MISLFPAELICMITELCSLRAQASLAESCRMLYSICKPILYRNDVINYQSSSVFYSIVYCRDQQDALKILKAAKEGGAVFTTCRDTKKWHPLSFHRIDATLHSPLHLAARRGLDDIVAYLIDQGLDIDDKEGVDRSRKTPLMEAILHHRESTAVLLVRRGASRGLRPPNSEALQAAIREGLTYVLRVMVELRGLDVNSEIGYGCTPLELAVCHRRGPMIATLLKLGARALPVMRRLCSDNAFSSIVWVLDWASPHVIESIQPDGMMELIFSIAAERVSSGDNKQQVLALERLLGHLYQEKQLYSNTAVLPSQDLGDFLDALLEMVLSVNYTDTRLASLFHDRGARIPSSVFLSLTRVLSSSLFKDNAQICLRRNPGLLYCFDFVHSRSLHCPVLSKRWVVKLFLDRVPGYILRMTEELKEHGLPLNRQGVEGLDLSSFKGRVLSV